MSFTPIGYALLACCILCCILNFQKIWNIALFFSIFQASAAVIIGSEDRQTGINPSYVVMIIACFVQCAALLTRPSRIDPEVRSVVRHFVPLTCFVVWACLGAVMAPILLGENLIVMRYGALGLGPLEFSVSTLRHSVYLCVSWLCCVTLAVSLQQTRLRDFASMIRWLRVTGWVAGLVLIWHTLSLYGYAPFPNEFFQNNPGAVQNAFGYMRPDLGRVIDLRRPSGTFSEPSFAAMYLSGFVGLLLGQFVYGKRTRLKVFELLAGIVLLLSTTSTTGLFALCLLAAAFFITSRRSIFGKQWTYYWPKLGLLGAVLGVVAFCAMTLSADFRGKVLESIDLMVTDKLATDSGKRSEVELNALRVMWDSYFLGGGLGSNECFTVAGYILSNTGILGGILLAVFARKTLNLSERATQSSLIHSSTATDIKSLLLFLWGLLLAGLVGVQMLFQPILWIAIAMLVGGCLKYRSVLAKLSSASQPAAPLSSAQCASA